MTGLLGLLVTATVNHQSKHVIVLVPKNVPSATILVPAKNKSVIWKSAHYQLQRNARAHGKSGVLVMLFVELVLVPANDHVSVEHQVVQDVKRTTPKLKSVKETLLLCASQVSGPSSVNARLSVIKPVNSSVTVIVNVHQN